MPSLKSQLSVSILPLAVIGSIVCLTLWAATPSVSTQPLPAATGEGAMPDPTIADVARQIDAALRAQWSEAGLTPAGPAEDLEVLRRLSLALHGTVPSLEEIRSFEADSSPDRLDRWVSAMLEDNRFNVYFAQRLSRVFVGYEEGQFLVFRRDRFNEWLTEQLAENVPYDELVNTLISSTGVWTGEPEVNFVTMAFANGDFDENQLATRTVRAFLGQSMDCAQCHNHPFSHWKQSEFEAIAACYGQVQLSLAGLHDNHRASYKVQDSKTLEDREVAPAVPFAGEAWPSEGSPRERLAAWITHPTNSRFHRATANRIWGLMFGRPYYQLAPVDDLPDPGDPDFAEETRVLDILAEDFRDHGCDLRRLIRVIASTRAFRMSSIHPDEALPAAQTEQHERAWALFPLIRLRPEQVIGSMLQAGSVQTIDQNSHLLVRTVRFFRENDYVNEFGDPGDAELEERPSTIPQALLQMNGQLVRELTEPSPFTAVGRIANMSSSPDKVLENCFLACLTRRPTQMEREQLLPPLAEQDQALADGAVQDLYWALFNSPEFSWNH
jgi:hypothetical protein